jgi:Uma2 family endonuclease
MENPSTRVRLTYRDILALPDDLLRHELIDGEHIVSPAPGTKHQRALLKLAVALETFLVAHPLGTVFIAPYDVLLSPHDMVEPDLVYISNERARRQLDEKRLNGPPDLAIEVLSPSTRRRDETKKLQLYERFGVPEYWLVDPEAETVHVHRLRARRLVQAAVLSRDAEGGAPDLSTPLIPGLAIPLGAIFE